MKALLVIDAQNVIVEHRDFSKELTKIKKTIKHFKTQNYPVIFIQQLEDSKESPFYKESAGAELHRSLKDFAEHIVEKNTPSSFFNTKLGELLDEFSVNHLFITGFNTEFCCLFTAIAAFDRGYKVTFIEDATGTVNTDENYGFPGLDIKDFIGTVLSWSNVIEVLYFDELEID
ncbi:MAG: isochorismatase family protein [Bacillota bacterium]|nr:isochorismatase family protein [Bacillota bacterium]